MRNITINNDWYFGQGPFDVGSRNRRHFGDRIVQLPHDYMIESEVFPEAPSGAASGYYNAGVAHYVREVEIPSSWEKDQIFLRLDGAMMNTTVEVNGEKAALHHNGYMPFQADITRMVYPGRVNRLVLTVNPSMQPNSRWYSGAGLFRGVELLHTPKLHLAFGGLSAATRKIEFDPEGEAETAFLQLSAEVRNEYAENRLAEVTFDLLREDSGECLLSRKTLTQVPPLSEVAAYMTMTVDRPALWSAETPNLYRLRVRIRDAGTYKTRIMPAAEPTEDAEEVLFGIRTVEADVKHGLRISGRPVKLKGGCLHHDNGVIGAISLYDAEARKVRLLKEAGFNAIRTTHNPPSSALIEACDRLGMYVFDEAFDAWGMGKQPGDYNQYFETDWLEDLSAFVRRDRCHPSVILWSTGNEITERAGLGKGYEWAARLAETIRRLDGSRPVSNAICSFWCGLDDELQEAEVRKWTESQGSLQNADLGGGEDLLWEQYTEGFANGLDIVGYNYMEDKYAQDHQLYPERVMLGSENFPKEIGLHWPMIEKTPWVIGDFTWTAWDYLGEAGIGKGIFLDPEDPALSDGTLMEALMASPFPWRTADDADFDITGRLLPQGVYRGIVWGSGKTGLFSYDPAVCGKTEYLSRWGFPGVTDSWTWRGREGKPVDVAVFSAAEEVELRLNGVRVARRRAGEAPVQGLPCSFLFRTVYTPGTLEAVSLRGGEEVSRSLLKTAGKPQTLRLTAETSALKADGASLAYVRVEVTDAEGNVVPDSEVSLTAVAAGPAELLGFGSGNPMTEENYTKGTFSAWRGRALAVLRAGHESGKAELTVSAQGLEPAKIVIPMN